jgi:hypothetical protein
MSASGLSYSLATQLDEDVGLHLGCIRDFFHSLYSRGFAGY